MIKINLAKSAGFCFGVKRAIKIALETALSDKNVYMLGDIVHNEDVARRIKAAGIRKVKRLAKAKNGDIFLIRAHGMGRKIAERARHLGYKVIDATCPMVKEIHQFGLKAEKEGYKIIIIGDKAHEEVLGIMGQLKKRALVIESDGPLPINKLKKIKKACIVVQSTQNSDKTMRIVAQLNRYIKDLKFFNTICRPTRMKQEEIKKLPLTNDAVLVIGSKDSANTKRLYEISRALNKKTYWVNSAREINPGWLRKVKTVGVTAGASTPDESTQAIIAFLKKIKPSHH